MTWNEHDGISLEGISASVLIISDSLFSGRRDISEDESGALAIDMLSNFGFESINLDYYPDEVTAIKSKIQDDTVAKVGLILLIGGTGIAPRDVTIDAIQEVITKELPGFGEEFRRKSIEQVGLKGLLTRVTAGTREESLIIGIPGSPKAVEVGINLIEGIMSHILQLLRG